MTSPSEELLEAARAVTLAEAAAVLGLRLIGRAREHPQPCPKCGGRDRFSFNTAKNEWVCRGEGVGGKDAIGMAAHVNDLDLRTREGLLAACSILTGIPVPDGDARESEADRAARLARIEASRRRNAEAAARAEREAHDFREAERRKARGIYEAAQDLRWPAARDGRAYLDRRAGAVPPSGWLRFSLAVTYWHGQDERGHAADLHCGPAMIAPIVVLRGDDHEVIGCHITWIDLGCPPKLRPALADPETGEFLPTKKMRGSKKGGLIPIAGDPSARRWLGGEGIENGVAIGGREGWRDDTFYFAAGDLGNLAGPAEPSSRFAHPTLTRPDRNGVERPVMIAGSVPRADQEPDDALAVPGHVDELVLLADGDSETVATAAAMVRAKTRLSRPGRLIPVVWPLPGTDWAGLIAGRDEAFETDGAGA